MQAAQLPPVAVLNDFSKRYQGVWRDLEEIRNSQDGWPSWCYVPSAKAVNVYASRARVGAEVLEIMTLVGALHALGSWRLSQNIYRFEPELAQAIIDTPLAASDVPVDVLLRLPEWSLYIELPAGANGLLEGLHGFWATLDYYDNFAPVLQFVTCNTGDLERRLAAGNGMIEGWNGMSDHNALTLYDLPLVPGMTIQEALDDSMRQVKSALSNPEHLSRRSTLEAMAGLPPSSPKVPPNLDPGKPPAKLVSGVFPFYAANGLTCPRRLRNASSFSASHRSTALCSPSQYSGSVRVAAARINALSTVTGTRPRHS